MLRVQERNSKLSPKFVGPRQIVRQLRGHKVEIYDLILNAYEIVHADRLKKRRAPSLRALIQLQLNPRTPLFRLSRTMYCLTFHRMIIPCVLADNFFFFWLGSRKCCLLSFSFSCTPFWLQTLHTSSRGSSLLI